MLMAINLGRLFGSRNQRTVDNLATQLTAMRNSVNEITAQNATLQQLLNISFRNQGGYARFDNINQIGFVRDGYNVSAAVYSIVSDIAQKCASIPLRAYTVVDDNALKAYKYFQKDFSVENNFHANELKKKALAEVGPDDGLQKLLDRPNKDDLPSVFWQEVTGFRLLCGNSFLYTPIMEMGADKGKITEMRIMPSPFTGLIVVQGYPPIVIG